MGTGQSKSSPDVQMRLRMENGFDEDDVSDITGGFGIAAQGRGGEVPRSHSNLSPREVPPKRQVNEEDEYFNNIYNKRGDSSLLSVGGGGGSSGVKSAHVVGKKKDSDPETAAAIAELEETFKVLGDGPPKNGETVGNTNGWDDGTLSTSEINRRDSQQKKGSSCQTGSSSSVKSKELNEYDQDSSDSSSADSSQLINYNNRQLISQAGDGSWNGGDMPRRHSKLSEINRTQLDSSGHSYPPAYSGSSSSSNSQTNMSSSTITRGGSEQRFLVSSYGGSTNGKQGKHPNSHNPQSLLMQQRKEFQIGQRRNDINLNSSKSSREIHKQEKKQDWTYQPPKIDGFDVDKFKQVNSKVTPAAIVILREEEDKGYYSQSPEVPSYTKDELDLLATLEREVY